MTYNVLDAKKDGVLRRFWIQIIRLVQEDGHLIERSARAAIYKNTFTTFLKKISRIWVTRPQTNIRHCAWNLPGDNVTWSFWKTEGGGNYSVIHELSANIICDILDPEFPVRRSSPGFDVRRYEYRWRQRRAIVCIPTVGIRVLHRIKN